MSLDDAWKDVSKFHECFNHPTNSKPTFIPKERSLKRAEWMKEEIEEFLESETIHGQADAMIDLIYFALGTLVEMGIKPQGLFDIVQKANMSKLWPDGKVHYREDGKVIKPSGWKDPENELLNAINKMAQEDAG